MKSGLIWLCVMLPKVISESYKVEKLDLDLVKVAFGQSDILKIAFAFIEAGFRARNMKDRYSYKVRKAKVGGYYENLYQSHIDYLKTILDWDLVKVFGY